jgi:hypothetical protein
MTALDNLLVNNALLPLKKFDIGPKLRVFLRLFLNGFS